jgi:hypothetical protein
VRPLRRRRGIGTSRPSSEDRSLASARRPGSSSCEASPLRDSAGISPASLGTAPSREPTAPGCPEAYRSRRATGCDYRAWSARLPEAKAGSTLKAPPSHTWRGPVGPAGPCGPGGALRPSGPWRPLSWLRARSPGSDTPRSSAEMARSRRFRKGIFPATMTLAEQTAQTWEGLRSLHDLPSMSNAVCNTR